MKHRRPLAAAVAALLTAGGLPAAAQAPAPLDSAFLAGFRWRSVGPAVTSGRITDVEGLPSPSSTFYVAAAAGGIWKTTNNGVTFKPIWDQTRVVSMGDLAIAPGDSLTLWAGTGEEDSRNSISPGGGIFKSTDGGESWQFMGLKETQAIGRIVVHPTNEDVVYVAALGAPWNENPERGLYKTTDGGRTWQLSKFVSDRAGFVDVAVDPRDPDVLFASSWERIRGPYSFQSGGPGSALWKTTDGGATWTEVEGGGFPGTTKGRIGIAIAPSDPDVVYAMVEADSLDGKRLSGLYRSADGGSTWTQMNDVNVRPFYYSQVRVDPSDANRVYWLATSTNFSKDGGKTVGQSAIGIHVDHHAMWWDPVNPDRFIMGTDGGIGITWDKGGAFDFVNTMALGQFYNVSFDMGIPYRVCGGLQDNGSWCGPSRRANAEPIENKHWDFVHSGDGFGTQQDPTNPNLIYATSQGGNMSRVNVATGERVRLARPDWRERTKALRDSVVILEESGGSAQRIAQLKQRIAADSAAFDLRYNWNNPFILSPHDPKVFYSGSNRVLKSTFHGEGLEPISPDLTHADPEKIRISTETTGGVTRDATGAETFHTIVSLAESPLRRGMLFAGTDDGRLWLSPDDGGTWEELTSRVPGVPEGTYVSRIEPSNHDPSTFYVTYDNHRRGDYTPYVLATTDGGRSFRSIASNLPTGSVDFVHVIREDPVNPDLLFVGTDLGVYVSTDRGGSWTRFMTEMPAVPVHDLKIHPRERELIAGTHGRSIWIVDIAPLQQLRRFTAAEPVLFEPKPALQYGDEFESWVFLAHKYFRGTSAPYGAEIAYWVPRGAAGATTTPAAAAPAEGRRQRGPRASIVVLDARGDTVQTLDGPASPGLQRAYWNLRERVPPRELSPSERRDSTENVRILEEVADSMIDAGGDRATIEGIVEALKEGDTSVFGGGGNYGTPSSPDRPGESYPAEAAEAPSGPDRTAIARQIRDAMEARGAPGFGGRGRGGPPAPLADPGAYTVHVKIGERTLSQPLRVIRAAGYPADQASTQQR